MLPALANTGSADLLAHGVTLAKKEGDIAIHRTCVTAAAVILDMFPLSGAKATLATLKPRLRAAFMTVEGKSSAYTHTDDALAMAKLWRDKYGDPDVETRHSFWDNVYSPATPEDMAVTLANTLATDFSVTSQAAFRRLVSPKTEERIDKREAKADTAAKAKAGDAAAVKTQAESKAERAARVAGQAKAYMEKAPAADVTAAILHAIAKRSDIDLNAILTAATDRVEELARAAVEAETKLAA